MLPLPWALRRPQSEPKLPCLRAAEPLRRANRAADSRYHATMDPAGEREVLWLSWGAAALWLTTGLGVLHPFYRQVGEQYLDRLHLPHAMMWAACGFEVLLAMAVAAMRPSALLVGLQVALIATFTIILASTEPMLLVHPFGVLSKNGPLVALLLASLLVAHEGWTPEAEWLLRGGMALVWVTEGLFPKVLFQQPMELAIVANSGLVPLSPSLFLVMLGVVQAASGVAALLLRGRLLRALLVAQIAALVVLPVLVSWQEPELWVHPFGPLTKNLPIIVGTLVVLRRC